MKISIIIPVHNLENLIIQCLNSVAAQDFNKSDYEILLVLDACSDNTEVIVKEWQNQHRSINLRILYSQVRTPGGARNVGLNHAMGDYVLFIDGDDKLINNSAMTILYSEPFIS